MSEERRTWTPDDVLLLRQLVDEYATGPELAERFDRPTGAIYTKLSTMGLKLKKRPEPQTHEWSGAHEIPHDPPKEPVVSAVPAPQETAPADMVDYAMRLMRIAEEFPGEVKIIGVGGDSDQGEAAVVFALGDQRYRLRLEELQWQGQR